MAQDALQEGYADKAKGNASQSAAAAHSQAPCTYISTKQTFWNIYLGWRKVISHVLEILLGADNKTNIFFEGLLCKPIEWSPIRINVLQ